MPWAAIIAELMKIFGPLLGELLKKLLDSLFNKVAKSLGDPVGTSSTKAVLLLNEAYEQLKGKPLRRLVVEKMLNHVQTNGLVKIEGQDRKEFKALAAVAA